MPRTIVKPEKQFCTHFNHNFINFVTDSLHYHGWVLNHQLITLATHFCISIFFHLKMSHNRTYSFFKDKQITNLYFLFTNNFFSFFQKHFYALETMSVIYGLSARVYRSLDGTPLGQPSLLSTPSLSKFKLTQCPTKTQFVQIV